MNVLAKFLCNDKLDCRTTGTLLIVKISTRVSDINAEYVHPPCIQSIGKKIPPLCLPLMLSPFLPRAHARPQEQEEIQQLEDQKRKQYEAEMARLEREAEERERQRRMEEHKEIQKKVSRAQRY